VDPNYFKKGIGSKMMQLVLKEFEASQYIVETGKQNVPAISLYEKFGF
jgi:ribosomal protein S18 acetylase RimI-like enzyme